MQHNAVLQNYCIIVSNPSMQLVRKNDFSSEALIGTKHGTKHGNKQCTLLL